ncbi:MAG: hypothetical protein ACFCVE_12290 [Phycisphaerae bacterium]
MSSISIILLFLALTVVVAVIFCAWLVVVVGRGVVRLLSLPFTRYESLEEGAPVMPGQQRCREPQCQAVNPGVATFCRRCGRQMRALPRQADAWSRAAL